MPIPMAKRSTATTSMVSKVNQTAIIEALRFGGPLSRQQIGSMTGLSPATVNRLTASLIREGLITREGQVPSTGGRPSVLLRYAGSSRVVAAIQVRADRVIGALIDFDGEFVHRQEVSFSDLAHVSEQPNILDDSRFRRMLDLFDRLIATADELATPCLAVGVSVPGVVQHPEGVVANLPELGWPQFGLGEILRSRSDIPVVIENDANALAYGELHRGVGRGVNSLVAVHLENGLGAGIITNGRLHRGFQYQAGEIGYLLMERSSLAKSYPLLGDLEDRVGSVALTRTARERGMPVEEGKLLVAEEIFGLARLGDTIAAGMVSEILDMVSLAVAAMSIILDPELVVVGSGLAANSDVVIPGIIERLSGRIIRVPRLASAALAEDAVIVGVAELAAHEVRGFTYLAG